MVAYCHGTFDTGICNSLRTQVQKERAKSVTKNKPLPHMYSISPDVVCSKYNVQLIAQLNVPRELKSTLLTMMVANTRCLCMYQ